MSKPEIVTQSEMRKLARQRFLAGRVASTQYALRLKQVARQIDAIVRGFVPDDDDAPGDVSSLIAMLRQYSTILTPWAESVAKRMVADVSSRDTMAWSRHGREIGRELRRQIADAPVGTALRAAQAEQVGLIRSLPLEAAQRVQQLAQDAFLKGLRPEALAKTLRTTGGVAKSRAMLIARDQTSKLAANLTMVRALHVGAESYVWHTAQDARVRTTHRQVNGKTFAYLKKALLSDGHLVNPGTDVQCRCWASPIID
jgi:SPP1 gp7 family putative phage head morphogenesis protein